ncbi:subtilisin-like serine protease [Ceratobasidium sp. 392]|nr:subtilisin-like serine protease [Ceratobasidium sp. 392]
MILNPGDLSSVQKAAGVKSIEPDSTVSLDYEVGFDGIGVDGNHDLSRSHETLEKRSDGRGQGVNVYGIDTGIYIEHNCFGGRAKWGATFGGYKDQDGHGHGTHTAGTAVGSGYEPGLATKSMIYAVKVLSDDGSGSTSDVIAGVEWASQHFNAMGVPSVATMSLGGTPNSAMDQAVKKAIAGGLHFTIAAGNSYVLAETSSPARVEEANTIGAVDESKRKASFSNFGPLIDVWAPGVNILSAWIGSRDANNTISGTSMATPYVAAVLANALSTYGQMSPDKLSQELKSHAAPVVEGATLSNNLFAQPW